MKSSRRYAIGFGVAVAGFTLFAAAVNTWINPLRVTPAPWTDSSFEPYREISNQIRTGKAGLIRSNGHPDVAFVGSSRVANGMDPEFAPWGDKLVLNLGCSGGFIYETIGVTRFLLQEEPPETILFGVDPGDLCNKVDTRPMADYYSSPFAPGGDRVDREIRYVVGISTLEDSWETFRRRRNDNLANYTPKGLRARSDKAGKRKQIDFVRMCLLGEAFLEEEGRKQPALNPAKVKALEEVLAEARAAGTRVLLYLHPQHAVLHARAADADNPPVIFAPERPALVDLVSRVNAADLPGPPVEFWDFFGFHEINCEPLPLDGQQEMQWWGDLGHFKLPVGRIIQSRMMGWEVPVPEGADFGVRLDSSNLEARLEEVKRQYGEYLRGPGKRDVAWKEELFKNKR